MPNKNKRMFFIVMEMRKFAFHILILEYNSTLVYGLVPVQKNRTSGSGVVENFNVEKVYPVSM